MNSWRSNIAQSARSGLDWYRQIAELIRHTDLPTLPDILVRSIRDVVGFDHSVVFGYPDRRRPVFLHDGFGSDHKRSAVGPYLDGTYLVDPFYEACMSAVEPGLYRMQDLAPDRFFADVGTHPGYVSPCISEEPGFLSEEIGFFARNEHGTYLVLSLMRPHDAPPFSAAEFAWLSRISPVVLATIAHHWRDVGVLMGASSGPTCLADQVDSAFESFGTPVLTRREQEVSRYILRGHSSDSIAEALGITVATVKIHRRNIYSKLRISSQSELFALFIDRLSSRGRSAVLQSTAA